MLSAIPENFWERVSDKVAKLIYDRETGAPQRTVSPSENKIAVMRNVLNEGADKNAGGA